MTGNKTKLIVLILIGVCTILLFVTILTYFSQTSKNNNTNLYIKEDVGVEEEVKEEIEKTTNDTKKGTTQKEKKKGGYEGDSYAKISTKPDLSGSYRYTKDNINEIIDYEVSNKFSEGDFSKQYFYKDGEGTFSMVEFNIYGVDEIILPEDPLETYPSLDVSDVKVNNFKWTIIKNFKKDDNINTQEEKNIVQYTEYEEGLYIVLSFSIEAEVENPDKALTLYEDIVESIVKKGEEKTSVSKGKSQEMKAFENDTSQEDKLVFSSNVTIDGNNEIIVGYMNAAEAENTKRFYSFDFSDKFESSLGYQYDFTNNGQELKVSLYVASKVVDKSEGDRIEKSTAEINGNTWNLLFVPVDENSTFKNIYGCGYSKIGDLYFVVEYKGTPGITEDEETMEILNNIFRTAEYIYNN